MGDRALRNCLGDVDPHLDGENGNQVMRPMQFWHCSPAGKVPRSHQAKPAGLKTTWTRDGGRVIERLGDFRECSRRFPGLRCTGPDLEF